MQGIGKNKFSPTILSDGQTLIPLNNHSQPNFDDHLQLHYTTDFDELVNFVYPDMTENAGLWNDHAILDTINYIIDLSNEVSNSLSAFFA